MRILHTSDLHLTNERPETIDALKELLKVASTKEVDFLTISGDVFENPSEADKLRTKLRNLFKEVDYRIIAIPGNHDGTILSQDFDFGFEVINEIPFGTIISDDLSIIGIPYTDSPSDELLLNLKKAQQDCPIRILLVHCTLDWGYSSESYGDEDEKSYFPVSRDQLSALGFDYILAGHFHSRTDIIKLKGGGTFVYPGSPVSHTRKESEKRHAVLIDTESNSLESIPLNTRYFDQLVLKVAPGKEQETESEIREWYSERKDDDCEMHIIVRGAIERKEKEFEDSIAEIAPDTEIWNETKDVKTVLKHDLFRRFKKKIENNEQIADIEGIEETVMEVMSNLMGADEI